MHSAPLHEALPGDSEPEPADDRIRWLTARFDNADLERTFQQASLPQARALMSGVTLLGVIASALSIYGTWMTLGPDVPAFWSTTWIRLSHILVAMSAMVVFLRAAHPVPVLGAAAVVMTTGCIAIALRLGVPPPPDAGLAGAFHITRDGLILLLFTALVVIVIVPAWFSVFTLIFLASFASYLWLINTQRSGISNPSNLTYMAVTAVAFVIALGNAVHRLRRDSFAARQRLHAVNRKLEILASNDDLTQCSNRRHFMSIAAEAVARAAREERPLSIMLMDIDHFKKINDDFGHATGDRYLQVFSETVRQAIRSVDLVGRVGGEEFAVLLPGTRLDEAKPVAERIRKRVGGLQGVVPRAATTVSIGMTEMRNARESLDTLLARADVRLYEAKHDGRNCVVADAAVD